MTTISIIGVGTMARELAVGAVGAGHNVQILGRDAAKADALAAEIGGGATAGPTRGDAPLGEVVVLALPYTAAASVVSEYGPQLAGKVVVDISNPFNESATGLATSRDSSAVEEIAAAAAPGVSMVKAFNTLFSGVLVAARSGGAPADVFLAGDDPDAKKSVSSFVESLGLRPLDFGDLHLAHWIEGAGLLIMRQALGRGDFSLNIKIVGE